VGTRPPSGACRAIRALLAWLSGDRTGKAAARAGQLWWLACLQACGGFRTDAFAKGVWWQVIAPPSPAEARRGEWVQLAKRCGVAALALRRPGLCGAMN